MKRNTLPAPDFLMSSHADTEANTGHNNSLNMWISWNVISAEWILYNTEIIDHQSEFMYFKCLFLMLCRLLYVMQRIY